MQKFNDLFIRVISVYRGEYFLDVAQYFDIFEFHQGVELNYFPRCLRKIVLGLLAGAKTVIYISTYACSYA